MKRIIPLILALLQIFSCTALAEEPVFSPEVEALYKANTALMDKYGHTHATLGLFAPKVHLYGETALVSTPSMTAMSPLSSPENTSS